MLRHLRKLGSITPGEAERVYTITRLASCIHEIRQVGYKVTTQMRQDEQGHKYAKYRFAETVN